MSADTSLPKHLGNYDVILKIAEGGMGSVFKAQHRATGEVVAIKVIAQSTAKNPVLLQRFEREFLAARVLEHPNVVRAIEYCGVGPQPFLVMEFVDGESLGQRVERAGAIPEADAVHLISQVCEGLQRAHKQGLVHRDVKPDNILVTLDGVAKLTDLGLVRDVDGDLNLTKTGRGLGTPHYMAPEQFRNAKNVDVRGDIYSLGATLYAMVTGVVPFENANPLDCWMKKIRNEFPAPRELNPALSDRIDWAIRRAMSAEPDRRPTSCREFLEDLTGLSRATPTHMGQPTPVADIWYLVYKDETGTTHTVKGTTEGVRKALREQLLGDASLVLVSRTKAGQFNPVTTVAEFRDLVVSPAPLPQSGHPRRAGTPQPLSKASGVLAQGATERQRRDSGAIDLGLTPHASATGSRSNRMAAPVSGRHAPPPSQVGKLTPKPLIDPHAETELYTPSSQPLPARLTEQPRYAAELPAEDAFDWSLLLIMIITMISIVLGYHLITN